MTSRRPLRRLVVAVLVALALLPAAAPAASATCRALLAGRRALVSLQIAGVLDEELLRLVRLGLSGRLEVQISVVRRRLLFSRTVARTQAALSLAWDEERRELLLDGVPVRPDEPLPVERVAVPLDEPITPDGHQVEATARFQVITKESLGSVARWLALGEGPQRSTLGKGLLSAVASDLTREASCSTPLRAGSR